MNGRWIGHNGGPTLEAGASWRKYAWTKARADLLPTLPIEVVRLRVKRAAEIGLDYRIYASFHAASGHDIVALLFSSNALRLLPPVPCLPQDRAERLAAVASCGRAALIHAPLMPDQALALAAPHLDHAAPAPRPFANWDETRAAVRQVLVPARWQADRVLMVGDTSDERRWSEAGRLAGYLAADRYFRM